MTRSASPGSAAAAWRSRASAQATASCVGPVPAKPLFLSAQQQARPSAPPHRPDAPSEFPDLRRPQGNGRHRLSRLRALRSAEFEPGHDGLLGDRRAGGFSDERHRRAAAHPEPSRRRRQDGGAQQARRQHADHLSRRRCRQARAERPDQARRRRNDPRGPGDGRHARLDRARREGRPRRSTSTRSTSSSTRSPRRSTGAAARS